MMTRSGKEKSMQEKTAGGTPAAPIKLDVSVRVIEPVKNLMGFASVKFNDCFVVENLKIVQGSKGLFLGMPSQPCLLYTSTGGKACKQGFATTPDKRRTFVRHSSTRDRDKRCV